MTRRMVEITFANAIRQAERLEECANEMSEIARGDIADISGDIAFAWQGHSASSYLAKMSVTADSIAGTSSRLRDIANDIREVAYRFRAAELRAIELAERREY